MSAPDRVSVARRWAPAAAFALAGGAGLLLLYAAHPIANGYRFPIGPDGPVYTWLARLAGGVGFRDAPGGGVGLPALTLLLGSGLRTEPIETITVLGPVLATACGLAAGAVLEVGLGADRLRTAVGIALTGAFAAYLAGGWLANIALVAVFLTAIAALAATTSGWRSVWCAAALLAAAGVTHRIFIAIGAGILLGAAALRLLRRRRGRDDVEGGISPLQLGMAAVAGPAAGLALGAWIAAGPRIPGDTSQDGFFRRLGLRELLLDRYRERFLGDVGRATAPLFTGIATATPWALERRSPAAPSRFLRDVLIAWAVLTGGGILLLAATGWGPPYRLIQFAFFVPLAAAAGLALLARRQHALSVLAGAAVVWFVATAMVGWARQTPAFSPEEVADAERAGAAVSSLPEHTPLIFLVDTDEPAAAYHVARAANVIRMGVPAERIPDVRLVVGQPDDLLAGQVTLTGDPEHDHIARVYLAEARPFLPEAAILVIDSFNPDGFVHAAASGDRIADGVVALSRAGELDSQATAGVRQPGGLGAAALLLLGLATLVLLGLLGWGWTRWAMPAAEPRAVALAAPTVGIAVAILTSVALDRIGILPGGPIPLALTVAVGAMGYALAARSDA